MFAELQRHGTYSVEHVISFIQALNQLHSHTHSHTHTMMHKETFAVVKRDKNLLFDKKEEILYPLFEQHCSRKQFSTFIQHVLHPVRKTNALLASLTSLMELKITRNTMTLLSDNLKHFQEILLAVITVGGLF